MLLAQGRLGVPMRGDVLMRCDPAPIGYAPTLDHDHATIASANSVSYPSSGPICATIARQSRYCCWITKLEVDARRGGLRTWRWVSEPKPSSSAVHAVKPCLGSGTRRLRGTGFALRRMAGFRIVISFAPPCAGRRAFDRTSETQIAERRKTPVQDLLEWGWLHHGGERLQHSLRGHGRLRVDRCRL